MDLKIKSDSRPTAEILQRKYIVISFDNGDLLWDFNESDLSIWWNGNLFVLSKERHRSPINAVVSFNAWASSFWTGEELLQEEG